MISTLLRNEPSGISGWLLVVGAGLLAFIVTHAIGVYSAAMALAAGKPVLLAMATHFVALVVTGIALALFARTSNAFPSIFMACLVLNVAVRVLQLVLPEVFAISQSASGRNVIRPVASALFTGVAGVLYTLRSRRVKNTFGLIQPDQQLS